METVTTLSAKNISQIKIITIISLVINVALGIVLINVWIGNTNVEKIPNEINPPLVSVTTIAEPEITRNIIIAKISDTNYINNKNEVSDAIVKTQSLEIQVTTTFVGEGGEGNIYIDKYDPINKIFSSIEKVGDNKMNLSEIYEVSYLDGELIRRNQKTGQIVERKEVDFFELKPINIDEIFQNFEPILNSDTDAIYDYKSTNKKAFGNKTVYSFVLHHNPYDVDEVIKFTINNATGIIETIDFPHWTGTTTYEIVKI